MEQYEAMMESSQLPISTSNHNPLSSYQGGPITFPQFPDNDNNPLANSAAYGSLPPGMTVVAGSYPTTPTTPGSGTGSGGGGGGAGGGGGSSAGGGGGNAGNSSLNLGGPYNAPTPTPGSQASPYSSNTTTSFSMPYDPPPTNMQQGGTPSLPPPMPTPPPHPPTPHTPQQQQQQQQHPQQQQQQQQSMKPIYSCTYCGLVLSSNNALIEHKRIHTGERPYACQVCNKRFTQKAHLNIHKRIHTGEKPYACHICHKRFAQSSHLSSHKRIHTGEKPFVCGICHIGFTQKQRLDAHLKKHMDRPGQDISSGMRRQPLVMANQARMGDRMEAYRQGLQRDDSVNMLHIVGQGMPYIKQETGINELTSPGGGGGTPNSHGLHHPGMDFKEDGTPREDIRERQQHPNVGDPGDKRREHQSMEGGDPNDRNQTGKSQNINAPSFSSEGMFLHPSGYVAYGGIEDEQESNHHHHHPGQPQQSPRGGGGDISASNPVGASIVGGQQNMSSPPSSGHRRKSSFVRKRQSESPDKDNGGESSEVVNGLHRFNALNQSADGSMHDAGMGANGSGGGGDDEDDEDDDDDTENGTGDDYKDTGEVLDDKNDPPYHGNIHSTPRSSYNDHPGFRKVSVPTSNVGMIETRSQARRSSSGHDEAMNGGDRMVGGMNAGQISYAGPANSYANSGLVKVNNRISLVNFTADELLNHLMKRDDVHCCQFCCLIFQDAAMYHIHRNMHDKQDIRKCNMCGKMLLDKYDFTAHFLSMHQS